jgi:hypothetical protein
MPISLALIGYLASRHAGVNFNALFRSGGVLCRIPVEQALAAGRQFDNRPFFGNVVIAH